MPAQYIEDSENIFLSAILRGGSQLYNIIDDIVEPEDMKWPSNSWILEAMNRIYLSDGEIDFASVCVELEKMGRLDSLISSMKESTVTGKDVILHLYNLENVKPENVETYAYQIREQVGVRQSVDLADKIKSLISNGTSVSEILGFIDLESGKIASFIGSKTSSIQTIQQVAQSAREHLEKAMRGDDRYILTGIKALDDVFGGFYPGRVYMPTASTGEGKSAFASTLVKNIAIDGVEYNTPNGNIKIRYPVGVITLEMVNLEYLKRIISSLTGIPTIRIDKGQLKPSEYRSDIQAEDGCISWEKALEKIESAQVYFDDSPELNLAVLRTKMRKMVELGAKVIFIDQLELIDLPRSMGHMATHEKYNEISYRIKKYANELDIPVILIHQMNRAINSGQNRGKNITPQAQDVNAGGDKGVNLVLAIRHIKEDGVIKGTYLYAVKNRDGATVKIPVKFIPERLLFVDVGIDEVPDMPDWIDD